MPSDTKSILEALLFSTNRLLAPEDIVEIFKTKSVKITPDELMDTVNQLNQEFTQTGRTFSIRDFGGRFRMCSLPEYAEWVRELLQIKTVEFLSKPALETLAIIAYRQPITKFEVEAVRGVSIDGVLKKLIELCLVDTAGKKEVPGHPFTYKTTDKFLEYFGLRSLDELPQRSELTKTIDKRARLQNSEESAVLSGEKEISQAEDTSVQVQEQKIEEAQDIEAIPADTGETENLLTPENLKENHSQKEEQ